MSVVLLCWVVGALCDFGVFVQEPLDAAAADCFGSSNWDFLLLRSYLCEFDVPDQTGPTQRILVCL